MKTTFDWKRISHHGEGGRGRGREGGGGGGGGGGDGSHTSTGTPLFWTPLGLSKLSVLFIEGCPSFRGLNQIHTKIASLGVRGVLNSGVQNRAVPL